MYKLSSEIYINRQLFSSVNDVKVNRSVNTLGATAVIKVPVTAVLKQKDQPDIITETAQAVRVMDEVVIRLGYGDALNEEFRGYVKQLNYKTPLEIECEDAFYLTRQRSVTLSGNTTLAECLQKCGLTIRHAVDLKLKNFAVDDKPVSWVLGKLKKDYGLNVFFDSSGQIIAGRAFDIVSQEVIYKLRYNVIKDDDLKYHRMSDVPLKVKAICYQKDGNKIEAEIGANGGVTKTLYFYDVEKLAELKVLAEQELKRYSRDGYEGKIDTFLLPYAEPCMLANLSDPTYPERDGTYYIESVETTYGLNGGRRKVSLGIKRKTPTPAAGR